VVSSSPLGIDTPKLFTKEAVVFLPSYNKSIERMYQDIMSDFEDFKKAVTGRIRELREE